MDSRQKFCLLSLVGKALREPAARFAFFLLDTPDLDDADRVFALSPEEIALINPNTGTLPIFRNRRDADLTAAIYRRIPVLWDETKRDGNPWGITFKNLFDMTDDSDLFRTRETLEADGWHLHGNVFTRAGKRMLPLYEAKMADFFNHRVADVIKSATAVNRQNQPRYLTEKSFRIPARCAIPLHWIAEDGLIPTRRKGQGRQGSRRLQRLAELKWERGWLCGWCDVTSSTNERTAIPAFLPRVAVGHKFPLMFPRVSPVLVAALIATQSSLVFDFVSRQKIGGISMGVFIWKQLPVPTPAMLEPHTGFLTPRVLELVYTAYDMTPLARDLGDDGAPFVWDEERRFADPGRAGCVLLPAVRDRAGRRGLHHGDVPDRERRTQAQRHRQVRLVPDQGDHPGVLRPDGGGRRRRGPVRDADYATSRAGSTASGQKRTVIPRVRNACGDGAATKREARVCGRVGSLPIRAQRSQPGRESGR